MGDSSDNFGPGTDGLGLFQQTVSDWWHVVRPSNVRGIATLRNWLGLIIKAVDSDEWLVVRKRRR